MKIKLLIISMTFPYPLKSGGKIRIYNLTKNLSNLCDITLLSFVDSPQDLIYISQLSQFCKDIQVVLLRPNIASKFIRIMKNIALVLKGWPLEVIIKYHPKMFTKLSKVLEKNDFDVIQFEYIQSAPYRIKLPDKYTNKTIIIAHDVSYISQFRKYLVSRGVAKWIWKREYLTMKRFEKKYYSMFSHIVSMSDVDRTKLEELDSNFKPCVIPNGVDIEYYKNVRVKKNQNRLLFCGWMRHHPNTDAISYFLREIFPIILKERKDIILDIVGGGVPKEVINFSKKYARNIVLHGFVRDIRPIVKAATVCVVPLRIGSGTRLKVLEAMAAGTAVVSTSIGCEGIDLQDSNHLLIRDDEEDFAQAVLSLLNDTSLRQHIELNAKQLVSKKYDWAIISQRQLNLYEELINA